MSHKAPALFTPYTLGTLSLANRIMVSPMCQYSAVDGVANDWHSQHYGSLALSGAGLLCFEATHISAQGRITPHCMGLWNEAQCDALTQLIKQLKKHSTTRLMIQLGHAGRKASTSSPWEGGKQIKSDQPLGWQTVAPSAIPQRIEEPAPSELTIENINTICAQFVHSALLAVKAGVDAIELHCAHGYLLHQFLSPVANQRQDDYGGSLDNRMRLPLQVLQAVKSAIPAHIVLGVRVSATDCLEHLDDIKSWRLQDTIAFVTQAKKMGCDFVDVSSGGISPLQKIEPKPGYQLPYAIAIKQACAIPTMTVGMFTEPEHANSVVEQDQADIVAIARGYLYNPRWSWHAAAALSATVMPVPQYARGLPFGAHHIFDNAVGA